jgi:hypothetical protein
MLQAMIGSAYGRSGRSQAVDAPMCKLVLTVSRAEARMLRFYHGRRIRLSGNSCVFDPRGIKRRHGNVHVRHPNLENGRTSKSPSTRPPYLLAYRPSSIKLVSYRSLAGYSDLATCGRGCTGRGVHHGTNRRHIRAVQSRYRATHISSATNQQGSKVTNQYGDGTIQ